MPLLVRTPSPFANESLLGFVLRVSESNGYNTPWHILRLAGIDQGQMQTAGFPVDRFAKILGYSSDALYRQAYWTNTDGGNFKILGHSLGQSLHNAPLRLNLPAFCPHCVEETGHIDGFWDLRAAIACPIHHCPPVRHCPSCEKPLRWFRPGLLLCSCGAHLSRAPSIAVDTSVIELMKVVQSKLHGEPLEGLPNECRFPLDLLESLPFLALLQILESLGRYQLYAQGEPTEGIPTAIAAAVAPLRDWPNGYHRFLTQLGKQLSEEMPAAIGLRGQFRPFYEEMFKNRAFAENTQFLRNEFVAFGLQHWGEAVADKKLLRTPASQAEQRFISKSEYARRYGLWKPTMDRMIADGSIVTRKVFAGKGTRVVVDLENSKTPANSTGIVTIRDAAKHLGLPVSVLRHLRDIGVFQTKPRNGFEQSWHKEDVKDFLMRGLALGNVGGPTHHSMLLKDAMRLKLRDTAAKSDIVAAIFDGRLQAKGRAGNNLGGLFVDKDELDDFVLGKRQQADRSSYTPAEVALLTGIDPTAILSALKIGLLSGSEIEGRIQIASSSVGRFNQQYVPLARIAHSLGSLAQHLWRLCRRHDIPVIAIPRAGASAVQPIIARESEKLVRGLWQSEQDAKVQKSVAHRRSAQVGALRAYIEDLKSKNEPLPRRAGKPNKAIIAKACGFPRDVLYDNAQAIKLLETYANNEDFGNSS